MTTKRTGPPRSRKQTITIRSTDNKGTGVTQVEVQATLLHDGLFAIHAAHGHQERWSLTHVPTGFRVCGCNSQVPLRRIACRLMSVSTVRSTDPATIRADGPSWLPIIREGLFS